MKLAVLLAAGMAGGAAHAEPAAVSLSGTYVLDLMADASGGARRGGGAMHRLLLSAEGASTDGWSAHSSLQHLAGLDLSAERVGDAQVVDNIDAPAGTAVYEAWVAKESADARLQLRAGVIDLNRDFDVQEVGALFLNSSHGVGPDLALTTEEGPSIFPRPGLAAVAAWAPDDRWRLQLGVFDGRRIDGALVIGEVERRRGPLVAQAGFWAYTAPAPRLGSDRGPRQVNRGGYALVEAELRPAREDAGPLRAWLRVGRSASALNPVDFYVGGGVVRDGLWKPGDSLGLAVAHARFSRTARALAGLQSGETTVELTYRLPMAKGFMVQPNLQFVANPSGDPHLADALVAGVRLHAAFGAS